MKDLIEYKAEKEGKVTPKACVENLLGAINRGEVESVVFAVKKTNNDITSGWSNQPALQALGLIETAKDDLLTEMNE
ncbi:MAG: hypothetical protein ABF608_07025 [Sporolactobacillus sp.]